LNTVSHSRPAYAPGDLAGLLFPQRCPLCDRVLPFDARLKAPLPPAFGSDVWVHRACHDRLQWVREPSCLRCGRPLADTQAQYCEACEKRRFSFESNTALWLYRDAARDSVAFFKYHGRRQNAVYYARALCAAHGAYFKALNAQALVPVPIHPSRLIKRGYNQAALLAYQLEKLLGIPCREDLLIRSKHTSAQKALGRSQRQQNMENAFRPGKEPKGIHRVILVDDIFTTGSTLEACSQVLKEAGVAEVYSITLCIAGE